MEHFAHLYMLETDRLGLTKYDESETGSTRVSALAAAIPYSVRGTMGLAVQETSSLTASQKLTHLLSQPSPLRGSGNPFTYYFHQKRRSLKLPGSQHAGGQIDGLRSWLEDQKGGSVTVRRVSCGLLILAETLRRRGVRKEPTTVQFRDPATVAETLMQASTSVGALDTHALTEEYLVHGRKWSLGTHPVIIAEGTKKEESETSVTVLVEGRVHFRVPAERERTEVQSV